MNRIARALLTAATGAVLALGAAPAAQATGTPDLVVTAVTWNSASPAAGSAVTFSATIKNTGTAATRAGVIHGVQFKVDGAMVTWSDTSTASLAPGASRTVTANYGPARTATWKATAGSHVVTAEVDDARRIAEGNETNNKRDRSLSVATATATTTAAASGTVDPTARVGTDAQGQQRVLVDAVLGSSGQATYVHSAVSGTVTVGCFREGVLVAGTEQAIGTRTVGVLGADRYAASTVDYVTADAAAGATRATAQTFHESILRSDYGAPSSITCAAGTTADFSRWQISRVESRRYAAATGALVSSAAKSVSVNFAL
ncbi:hypothetical protein NUM3379_00260 [Kineococcus sp. NUM-3379]